ncbi:uncharacterized protein LOC124263411 [Haliotis rubra]|uniref:uncharacterized protein LOC124263411 n=1 Tax=Haliotis rubra TaxID=36100 RepID=UPI001EE5E69A|nr:uncharacterized protein LOC124263411 [Haliotis rubra]
MNSITTNRSDFPEHELTPRESFKPAATALHTDVPFDGNTTNRADYPEHEIQTRVKRLQQEYVKPEGKMEGATTNRSDYPEHAISQRVSYKPVHSVQKSDDPFDDKTTTREDYPEHNIEPRGKREAHPYIKPEGAMESTTSNRLDYPEHALSQRESFKPTDAVQRSNIPFDDQTTARMDYPEHQIEPRQRREHLKYVKPDGEMNSITTNRSDFPEHELTPRESFKPATTALHTDVPFDGNTTNRADYPEHEIQTRVKRLQQEYVKPEGKMEGATTNRSDYPEHAISQRVSYKPVHSVQKSDDPFDDKTTTREDYPEHNIEPRGKREAHPYIKPEGAMESTTSNRLDYPEHALSQRESFKPTDAVQRSNVPFDDQTTARMDYPEHQIEPRQRREHLKYVKPDGEMNSITTNRSDFPEHELTPRESFKPAATALHTDVPFDGNTTNRADYPEHEIQTRAKWLPQEYVKPEGKMEGATTNRSDYPEHVISQRVSYKPVHSVQKSDDPFDDKTTTREDYPEHNIEPRGKREAHPYIKPEGAMESTTSNRLDYPEHALSQRESFKPTDAVQRSNVPFDDQTTARMDYPEHQIEPRQRREHLKYVKPDGEMNSITTNRSDFPEHELTPRESFKPAATALHTDVPFDGNTTNRADYPEHEIQTRAKWLPQEYVKPEGKMEGATTNRSDYPEHVISQRVSYKPVHSVQKSDDPFDDKTTTREDYPEHNIEPRGKREAHPYIKPEGAMESTTSNRLDYPEHALSQRESFKPTDAVQRSNVPFDDQTTARMDYQEHQIEPRRIKEPVQYVRPEGKFEAMSTNRSEFIEHEITPRESYKPRNEPLQTGVPLNDQTTNKFDYCEHKVEPRIAIQKNPYKKPEGDMNFSTTNRDNYTEKAAVREPVKRPESAHIMEINGQFDSGTSYGSDFKGHDITPRELLNKKESYQRPTVSMATASSQQLDYPKHQLPPKVPHKVVPYTAPTVKFVGSTTTSDSFKGDFVPKQKSYKPSGEPYRSNVPLDGTTTARNDYQEHKIEPRKVVVPEPYRKPDGSMDFSTINQQQFTSKASPRETIKRQESSHIMEMKGKFEGSTRYNADFVSHGVHPRETVKKSQDYVPPAVKMEGNTTNRMAFTEKSIEPRQSFKPPTDVPKLDIPFDGRTGYSDTFVGHEIQPKQLKAKSEYIAPATKFSGSTTTGDSYKGVFAPKQQSYRPSMEPYTSGVPLEGTTTAKQDFKAHKVEPRWVKERQAYTTPEGGFDFNTTNRINFTAKDTPRQQTVTKPLSSGVMKSGGQFEGSTSYGADFKTHDLASRPVKKNPEYVSPAVPMASDTTSKRDFTEHTLTQRQNFKPTHTVQKSQEPFMGSTGYRDTFKEHQLSQKTIKQKEEYNYPKEPFHGVTTNMQDFTGTTVPKRTALKPAENTLRSSAPVESTTTARRDYGSYQVGSRPVKRQDAYVRPEGQMDLRTTNNEYFKQPETTGRQASKRPTSSGALKFEGKIDFGTNYSNSFQKSEAANRPERKVKEAFVPNPVPFQGMTTHQAEFINRHGSKANSFKPAPVPFSSNAKFDSSTTYSADFHKGTPPWMTNVPGPAAVGAQA